MDLVQLEQEDPRSALEPGASTLGPGSVKSFGKPSLVHNRLKLSSYTLALSSRGRAEAKPQVITPGVLACSGHPTPKSSWRLHTFQF